MKLKIARPQSGEPPLTNNLVIPIQKSNNKGEGNFIHIPFNIEAVPSRITTNAGGVDIIENEDGTISVHILGSLAHKTVVAEAFGTGHLIKLQVK